MLQFRAEPAGRLVQRPVEEWCLYPCLLSSQLLVQFDWDAVFVCSFTSLEASGQPLRVVSVSIAFWHWLIYSVSVKLLAGIACFQLCPVLCFASLSSKNADLVSEVGYSFLGSLLVIWMYLDYRIYIKAWKTMQLSWLDFINTGVL